MGDLVRVLDASMVERIRALQPITTFNYYEREHTDTPELIRIDNERVGCRACGCPIDRGRMAVKVLCFTQFHKRSHPTTVYYLHSDDCWAEGYVQTIGRHGYPGVIRFVRDGRAWDAFYDASNPTLTTQSVTLTHAVTDEASGSTAPVAMILAFTNVVDTGIKGTNHLASLQRAAARAKYEEERRKRAA